MLMVFYGEYVVAITQGTRLVLPKKIRERLFGSQFVITRGFDSCLAGYDAQDWQTRSQEYLSSSLINTANIELRRIVFSGAVYIEFDDQGRFVLPKSLSSDFSGTEKAIFVGVGDHFEIWNEQKWQQYLKEASKQTDLLGKK